jgi:hypothetical protein
MARQIWVFAFPLGIPNSFDSPEELVEYIKDGIFMHEASRLRHSNRMPTSDGDVIVLCQSAQLYGHFEITKWEEPNEDDRRLFPRVRRVYIVRQSAIYDSPVPLSAVDVTQIRFGREITEDTFEQIIRLAGSVEQFSDIPQLPKSTVELERVLRAVKERLGQSDFRQQLLVAYESRCAFTGYDATEALEAAHIDAYAGRATNQTSNGLLLRGDIHTLFDLNRLAINPETFQIAVSPALLRTQYANLVGTRVKTPSNEAHKPSPEALKRRWQRFGALPS